MLCEAKDQKLCFWRVKMTDFLSVDLSVALNIHLCHADCHACYIKNTFCVRQVQHLFLWPSLERPFIITTFLVVLFCLFVLFSSGSCFLLLRKSVETGAREMYRKWRPPTFCTAVKVVPKVWYLVGIDLIEAPTTSQNGNRFLQSRRCKRPL